MARSSKGFFIVFEGGEGSGKSTQANILYGRLCQHRYPARLVQEPGSTPLGEYIKFLFAAPRTLEAMWNAYATSALVKAAPGAQVASREFFSPICADAELLLFEASRAQLMAEKIIPFLDKGIVVVCDRFVYSTLAYQGYGRGLDLELIHQLNARVTKGVRPDCVVFIDIEPEKGVQRKLKGGEASRFEKEQLEFHRRVREGYLRLMAQAQEKWLRVDGSLPRAQVSATIWKELQDILPPARLSPHARPSATKPSLL